MQEYKDKVVGLRSRANSAPQPNKYIVDAILDLYQEIEALEAKLKKATRKPRKPRAKK